MSPFSVISRFFAWWFGELHSLLPGGLRRRFSDSADQLQVFLSERGARFSHGQGAVGTDLGQVAFEPDNPQKERNAVQRLLRRGKAAGQGATVLLDDSKVLRPTVELPRAAEENLNEVLAFEMDRNTPFKADEVYFDHRVHENDKEPHRITVDLVVALRSEVEQALRVVRAWGVQPNRISVAAGQAGSLFDLMPDSERRPEGRLLKRLSGALAVAFCVLVAIALYLPLQHKQERLAEVRERLDVVRKEALAAGELQERIEAMSQRDSYVVDRKHEAPPVVTLIHDVTRMMPDDTWLIHFAWRKGELRLAGYSGQPTTLIRVLEESAMLSEVSFASPVTLDPRLGLERFNISARAMPVEGGEAQ